MTISIQPKFSHLFHKSMKNLNKLLSKIQIQYISIKSYEGRHRLFIGLWAKKNNSYPNDMMSDQIKGGAVRD